MYSLNPSLYSSVYVVPTVIVDKYIKMASFCAIKSLLWILRNQGGNFSATEIAKSIGSSESDTKEALEYWLSEGILIDSQVELTPTPVKSDTQYKSAQELPPKEENTEKPAVPEIKMYRPTMEQIVKRMEENNGIKALFNEAQKMLGRTIGFDMQSSLLMMYDTYGLDFDIILTIIQYCVDKNKASNAFMASVAKSWYEKGITTLELAHEYIDAHDKADLIFNEFKQFTGITAPKASPKQSEFFIEWSAMGFSVEMMVLAYNETVDRTGKISFSYTNKILKNWHESGYKTPADIENGKEKFKAAKQAANSSSKRSYDIDKALEKAEYEPIKYKKREKRS